MLTMNRKVCFMTIIKKVNVLPPPNEWVANAIYLLKSEDTGLLDFYVVDGNSLLVYRTMSKDDVVSSVLIYSDTEPALPNIKKLWWHTLENKLYVQDESLGLPVWATALPSTALPILAGTGVAETYARSDHDHDADYEPLGSSAGILDAAKLDATNKANTAKSEAIASAALDATTKANTAEETAITTAALDATSKADAAKLDAIAAAALDAANKADTAQSNAITAAGLDATSKSNTAKAEAIAASALDATNKSNTAKQDAITAAALDATSKANTAKAEAITEAGTLVNTAKNEAITAAGLDATTKSNTAKSEAIAASSLDATSKADAAKSEAITAAGVLADAAEESAVTRSNAYTDTAAAAAVDTAALIATSKADAAKSEAIAASAIDATAKAGTAKTEAIASAALDATSKASLAESAAKTFATLEATSAQNAAIAVAATDATSKANTAKSEAIAVAALDATDKVATAQTATLLSASNDATSKITALKGGVSNDGDTLAKLRGLISNLETILVSNDVNLDSLQEVVTFIKANESSLSALGSTKVNISDIIDTLNNTSTNKPLSAAQGKVLKDYLDALTITVNNITPGLAGGAAGQYPDGSGVWRNFQNDVRDTPLTGLSVATSTDVVATDTQLVAVGKLQAKAASQSSALQTHAAAANPHGTTAADVGADPSGTASSVLSAHVIAADPHSQYALRTLLGDASSKNVGTVAGTVAAGDDVRFSDARTPTTHTHTVSQLSDGSVIGKSIVVAADAAAIRTILGLGTAALVNTGTGATNVILGNDARLTDARAPTAHTHTASQISDGSVIGKGIVVAVDAAAVRSLLGLGTAALTNTGTGATNTILGNDARLTDARAPTAHTHTASQISDGSVIGKGIVVATDAAAVRTLLALGTAATVNTGTGATDVILGNDSRLTDARAPTAHNHTVSQLSDASTYGRSLIVAADAAASRTLLGLGTAATANTGTGATNVILGNDARLTDARTPTTHSHTASQISDGTVIGRGIVVATDAATVRTLLGLGNTATRNIGTTSGTVAAGDDSRLTDARAPTAHTHAATDINDSTATGRALVKAADAAAGRTALSLGTLSTQASDNVTITGGSVQATAVAATTLSTSAAVSFGLTSKGNGLGSPLVNVIETAAQTSAANWTKIARVTLGARYDEESFVLSAMLHGVTSLSSFGGYVSFRVRQEAAFGSAPIVLLNQLGIFSDTGILFGYVVVSNAGPTIVDLYVNYAHVGSYLSFSQVGYSPVQKTDYISAGAFVTTPAGLVASGLLNITAGAGTFNSLNIGGQAVVLTNDSRLSDARTPVTHSHTLSQVSDATAYGRSLSAAADAAAVRTLLGLGTISTQNADAITITSNTANPALKITQTGTGNILLIEDQSGDSTPLVIDSNGNILKNKTSPQTLAGGYIPGVQIEGVSSVNNSAVLITQHRADSESGDLFFGKSRSTVSNGVSSVLAGDNLGNIRYTAGDGEKLSEGARIQVIATADASVDSVPCAILFLTSPTGTRAPAERMRIGSSGEISFGGIGLPNVNVYSRRSLTGGAYSYDFYSRSTALADVTSEFGCFISQPSTAPNLAINTIKHFNATQETFNAGSVVQNQICYDVSAVCIGAVKNYGFRGRLAAGTGRWNLYMDGGADNFIGGATTISVNTDSDALKITQTGTGDCFVVEDSASDTTPFVINNAGQVLIGTQTSRNIGVTPAFQLEGLGSSGSTFLFTRNSADSSAPTFRTLKTRGTVNGAFDSVISGDTLFQMIFYGAQGDSAASAGGIWAAVDGTPGVTSMPGRLVFATTPTGAISSQEALRIDSEQRLVLTSGKLRIATGAAATKLLQTDASGNATWGPTVGQADTGIPTNSDIRSYYNARYTPPVLPSLEMDFSRNRFSRYIASTNMRKKYGSWQEFATDLGADLSISRASPQVYFDALGKMRTATDNVVMPDHNPATGECLGPYIGLPATNLALNSNNDANWSLANITVDSTWTAPDGTSASVFLASSATDTHRTTIPTFGSTVGASVCTISGYFYFPPGTDVGRIYFRGRSLDAGQISGCAVTINTTGTLANRTFTFTSAGPFGTAPPPSVTSTALRAERVSGTEDIWRISITSQVSNSATATAFQMDMSFCVASEADAGTANTKLGIWGAQYEIGTSATPLIQTTTTSVTRQATTMSIGGTAFSEFYNQKSGTFTATVYRNEFTGAIANFSDGTNNNRLYMIPSSSSGGNINVIITNGGASQGQPYAVTALGLMRVAFGYALNDFVISANGSAVSTDTSGLVPSGIDRVYIGTNGVTNYQPNNYMSKFVYYPRKFDNTAYPELSK